MLERVRLTVIVTAAVALATGCASRYFTDAGPAPQVPSYTLATLPHKETWTGIVFNGAKIGFSNSRVEPSAEGGLHRLRSQAVLRLRFLGFDKNIRLQAEDFVRDDLSLDRFNYHYHIDGSDLRLRGEVVLGNLNVEVETGGVATRQALALTQPVYPTSALALMPVLRGLEVGRAHRFTVYNGEVQQLGEVGQRIEAFENSSLFQGSAFKVLTEMMGLKTTTWIDPQGRPLLEIGLNGVMISALEDEATAKQYLAIAALNKNDTLLQWSLVKADRPLPGARGVRRLRISLTGAPGAVPSDARQACARAGAEIVCEIDAAGQAAAAGDQSRHLAPSATVQSADPSIRALSASILASTAQGADRVGALLRWMDQNIGKEAADVFSALDVLQLKRAECQGHAYLYAALARAAGIPTRVANGLVYSVDHEGFLYHTWAESLVDGAWQAVDPIFAQRRADATHLALFYGESLADLVPLVDWVGRVGVRVLDASQD